MTSRFELAWSAALGQYLELRSLSDGKKIKPISDSDEESADAADAAAAAPLLLLLSLLSCSTM